MADKSDPSPVRMTGGNTVELPPEPATEPEREGVFKATVLEIDREQNPVRDLLNAFGARTANTSALLEPPYDPDKLLVLIEASSGLRPNIDAYVTNIDSYGYRFEPAINLNAPDAFERVKSAMVLERMMEAEESAIAKAAVERIAKSNGDGTVPDLSYIGQAVTDDLDAVDAVGEPTDDEVKARLVKLKRLALLELHRLRAFFAFANPDASFTTLRRQTRSEIEGIGNGYWEMLRDKANRLARMSHVPAATVRMTAQDKDPILVIEQVQVSDLIWREVQQPRRFRRYAQVSSIERVGEGTRVEATIWFKEFGDPRVVSRTSGEIYPTVEALKAREPDGKPATEILHFLLFSASSAYGIPRWVGNLPGVLGSRELDEVNESYFDNKAVPPLVILCSGGRFASSSIRRFEDFFKSSVRGRQNFHRIAFLEAEPAARSPEGATAPHQLPRVSFERLRDAQQDDALFQKYDERNASKLSTSFRAPDALRGGGTGAAILAGLRQGEVQVFKPERNEFDDHMNRRVLPAIPVRFWKFRSNAPELHDPETLGKVIAALADAGVVTPGEARELAAGVFNRELPPINEEWTKRPLSITLATMRSVSGPAEAARVTEGTTTTPQSVLGLIAKPTDEDAAVIGGEGAEPPPEETEARPPQPIPQGKKRKERQRRAPKPEPEASDLDQDDELDGGPRA